MKVGFFKEYIYTIERNNNGSIVCKSDNHKQIYYGYSEHEAVHKFRLYLDTIQFQFVLLIKGLQYAPLFLCSYVKKQVKYWNSAELRKNHPEYYDGVDVNFTNLLEAYSAPSPKDHFYMKVFGKTYSEKMAESEFDKSQRESVK